MDEERKKKLEAGKEKLVAFQQRCSNTNVQCSKKARLQDPDGDHEGDFSSGERSSGLRGVSLSSKSAVSTVSCDEIEESKALLSDMEHLIQSSHDEIKSVNMEILTDDSGSKSNIGNHQEYHARLYEFQVALTQRDNMIGQLTVSLESAVSHRDKLNQDVHQLEFTVKELQDRLQRTTQLIDASPGSSPVKLLSRCQEKLTKCEDRVRQQMHEIETLTVVGITKDKEMAKNKAELCQLKKQSAEEAKKLMKDVQVLHQEASSLRAEHQDLMEASARDIATQRSDLEEKFGLQLTHMKEELRKLQAQQQQLMEDQHRQQLDLVKHTHQEEVTSLREALNAYSSTSDVQSVESEKLLSLSFELESLKSQLSENGEEKRRLDELCQEKDLELSQLLERCRSLEIEKQKSEEMLTQKLSQLQNKFEENTNAISQLTDKCLLLETENNSLTSKLCAIEIERETLKLEVNKVRSLQSKCDVLSAECAALLSEKKDSEHEVEVLYSEVKKLKLQLAQKKKTAQSIEELPSVGFENEFDAAEKGVFSPKRQKLDISTSPGSIIVWIEKCENLEKDLRTAQANTTRLQTQLKNNELHSKLISEEKSSLQNKIKDLHEKNSSLQKTYNSLSRCKQLMNQYEMKIASLENEKSNLQSSLEQLGIELKRSTTCYEDKMCDLQQKLCNTLNLKTDSFEEIILESCSKAKELVTLRETLRLKCEHERELENKLKLCKQLSEEQEKRLKSCDDQLEDSVSQLVSVWQQLSQREEEIAEKSRELSLLGLHVEQLESQLNLHNIVGSVSVKNELQVLINELSKEICQLKVALTVEKSVNDKLCRLSPHQNQHTHLINKLQQQQLIMDEMKMESSDVGDSVSRLEKKLCEMIDDLSSNSSQLSDSQDTASQLEVNLIAQRRQMELLLQEKAEVALQFQQEQNILHNTYLQLQVLLKEKDQKYEVLKYQLLTTENELNSVRATLHAKQQFINDLDSKLESEVRRRDLQIQQLQAKLTCAQLDFVVPERLTCDVFTKISDSEDSLRLEKLRCSLEEIHAAAVSKLRHHLSEQMKISESELRVENSKLVTEQQEHHLNQMEKLHQSLEVKEEQSRGDALANVMSELGLEHCENIVQAAAQLQEKLREDINLLKQELPPSSALESLELKFHQLAQQEIMLAVAKLQDDTKSSFMRQIASLTQLQEERLANLKYKLELEKQSEILKMEKERDSAQVCRENLESGKLKSLEVVATLIKQEKDQQNEALLQKLENSTTSQFSTAVKNLCHHWMTKCKEQLATTFQQLDSCSSDTAEDLLSRRDQLISGLTQMQEKLTESYTVELAKLSLFLRSSHVTLQADVSHEQQLEILGHQVSLITAERDSLNRELVRLHQVIIEFEASSQGFKEIVTLKNEKHKKEMDDLRTYFEQKCSSPKKEYTEKVLSQHIRNSSSSCSVNSMEISCADSQHAATRNDDMAEVNKQDLLQHVQFQTQSSLIANESMVAPSGEDAEAEIKPRANEFISQEINTLKENMHREQAAIAVNDEHTLATLSEQHRQQLENMRLQCDEELREAKIGYECKVTSLIFDHETEFQKVLTSEMERQTVLEDGSECCPELLRVLHERLGGADARKELNQIREQYQQLKEQLSTQSTPRSSSTFELRLQCRLLRSLLNEILEYLVTLDDTLNRDETAASRRVHFAPDVDKVKELMKEENLTIAAVQELQSVLDICLSRVRSELADLLGLNEFSLVESGGPSRQLETRMAASEARCRELEGQLRYALAERSTEIVSEGYGEGDDGNLELSKRLSKLAEVQDKALCLLSEDKAQLPASLRHLVQELCSEGDRLAEEARRDRDDLKQQIEAADHKIKSYRNFVDEQSAERELERDELARLQRALDTAVRERNQDRIDRLRYIKDIESLECQAKETAQKLHEAELGADELTADLKAANDKISVLRDVIQDLESQLHAKLQEQDTYHKQLSSLQTALDLQPDKEGTNDVSYMSEQIAVLEEQLVFYTQKLEHLMQDSPAEMKAMLRSMEASVEKRTRDLERVLSVTLTSTCSSPSEDVSVRDRLPRSEVFSPDEIRAVSPLSLRTLYDRLTAHGRVEEAACKRVTDLEMQLTAARQAEEELEAERLALRKNVETHALQVSELQASLDQQRLTQKALDTREAAITRRQLNAAAERLDAVKELLQAKENEIVELRGQLEHTRTVITSREQTLAQHARENQKLRATLEEVEADGFDNRPARGGSRLLASLLTEKNAEIDELGSHISQLHDRLDIISSQLSSDITKEDLLALVREVRASQCQLKSHCSALHGTLNNTSMNLELVRKVEDEHNDILASESSVNRTLPNSSYLHPDLPSMPKIPIFESAVSVAIVKSPLPPTIPGPTYEEMEVLENEMTTTKQALADKQQELTQMVAQSNQVEENMVKLSDEMRQLQEENVQLRLELSAVTGRLLEYSQALQNELDLQDGHHENIESDSVQELVGKVHKCSVEVLKESESALLVTCATQTTRSTCVETKKISELQQQLKDLQDEYEQRESKSIANLEYLEKMVAQHKLWLSEARQAQDNAESSLAAERRALHETRQTLADMETRFREEKLACEESKQNFEELQGLKEKAEEVQTQVEQQQRLVQVYKLEFEKEQMRVASLQSSLAEERLNCLKLRAKLEGETVRHRLTMDRKVLLDELLAGKVKHIEELESSLQRARDVEHGLRNSLQEQIDKARNSSHITCVNSELQENFERERKRNAELIKNINEERKRQSTQLSNCILMEKRCAQTELDAERQTLRVTRQALQEAQTELQDTLALVQADHEEASRLSSRVRELENQLAMSRETMKLASVRAQREKEELICVKTSLEASLKLLEESKNSSDQEAAKLRQQLAESRHFRDTNQGDELLKVNQEAERLRIRRDAERLAWASERSVLTSQLRKAQNDAVAARSLLTVERSSWILEKQRMKNSSRESLNGSLTTLESVDHPTQTRIQYLFGRYLREHSWKKSLVFQKRYLLLLVRSYQDNLDRLKQALHSAQSTSPTPVSPLRRFKGAVFASIAVERMKIIVRAHLISYNVGTGVIMQKIGQVLISSPEPRLEPSNSDSLTREASGLTPPTRDNSRNSSPRFSGTPLSSRGQLGRNEYFVRSELLQQKLGLNKQ